MNADDFVKIWNSSNDVDEVVAKTGLTRTYVLGKSSKLRVSGVSMKRMPRRSKKLEKKIISYLQQHPDEARADIAAKFNVSISQIANIKKRANLQHKRIEPGLEADIVAYLKRHPGESGPDVAKEFDISVNVIRRIRKKHNLSRQSGEEKFAAIYKNCASIREVQERTGLKLATIRYYISRLQLEMLPAGDGDNSEEMLSSAKGHNYKEFATIWNSSESLADFLEAYPKPISKSTATRQAAIIRSTTNLHLKFFSRANTHAAPRFIAIWNTSSSVEEAARRYGQRSVAATKSRAAQLRTQGYWLKDMKSKTTHLRCPACHSLSYTRDGYVNGTARFKCADCGRKFTSTTVLDAIAKVNGFKSWRDAELAIANGEATVQLWKKDE